MKEFLLASICNDTENSQNYKVIGDQAYHLDTLIGELQVEMSSNVISISFKPITPVSVITFTGVLIQD